LRESESASFRADFVLPRASNNVEVYPPWTAEPHSSISAAQQAPCF
jgi:hypothetical protein